MANSVKTHINLVGGSSAPPSKPKKRKKMSGGRGAKPGGKSTVVRERGTSRNPR